MAYHGHWVKLYDRDATSLNSAHQRIEEDKIQLQTDGLLVHGNFVVRSANGRENYCEQ